EKRAIEEEVEERGAGIPPPAGRIGGSPADGNVRPCREPAPDRAVARARAQKLCTKLESRGTCVPLRRSAAMTWDYTLSLPLGALVGLASVAFVVGLVLH